MRKTLNGWASQLTTIQVSKNTLQKLQMLKMKFNARSYEELINTMISLVENSKDPIKEKLCSEYWETRAGPVPPKGWMLIFIKLNILKENGDGTFALSEEFCRGYITNNGRGEG